MEYPIIKLSDKESIRGYIEVNEHGEYYVVLHFFKLDKDTWNGLPEFPDDIHIHDKHQEVLCERPLNKTHDQEKNVFNYFMFRAYPNQTYGIYRNHRFLASFKVVIPRPVLEVTSQHN